METLADAYRRAVRAVRAAPTHVERFMLEALAEDAVVSDLLQRNARESAARVVPADAELTAIDAAVLRALVAETVVEFRCAVHIGHTDRRLPPLGSEDRERTIASWAADVIVRRRVEVRPLEAEPTAAQLADWLEAFSKALTLALARAEMVRVPSYIGGLLDLFAEGTTERATRSPSDAEKVLELQRREMARDRTFRTFSAGDLQHWRLTPPVGHTSPLFALDAPFERGTSPKHGRGVRSVLTGQLLRAYTATWALTDAWTTEHGGMNPHGLFEMRVRDVLTDLYGLPSAYTTVRGKRYPRPRTTAETEFGDTFETLHLCLLEGIDNISVSAPEPLLTRYRDDNTGRTVYRQAPLAMLALQRHFIQVPREVLRLGSLDTPLALGVARGLRYYASTILRGPGHWRCTLEELARVAGDPIAARRNRGARAAYSLLAARLQRVVRDGALGDVHVEGEGPDAVVTLTPSDALGTVYSSLAEPRAAEPLEAAVAKALTAKRRPGRPRKGPLA